MPRDGVSSSLLQTVRRHVFIKDEFYYLNVPKFGTVAVSDAFDCTFECLSNPMCFSVNLAASKRADGKFCCELLSSDKYRSPEEYKENSTSHHHYIKVIKEYFKRFPYVVLLDKTLNSHSALLHLGV